jgi:hypothetical protein
MTTLKAWLGSTTRIDPRSLSPVRAAREIPDRVVLGVLGTRNTIRLADLEEQILSPAMEAWGTPDEIILPAGSESSAAIQAWATRREIPCTLVACDWAAQGRRAAILRDARIQREATHLVLLQGPRSSALSTLAKRLGKKGRPVAISERPGQPIQCPE